MSNKNAKRFSDQMPLIKKCLGQLIPFFDYGDSLKSDEMLEGGDYR